MLLLQPLFQSLLINSVTWFAVNLFFLPLTHLKSFIILVVLTRTRWMSSAWLVLLTLFSVVAPASVVSLVDFVSVGVLYIPRSILSLVVSSFLSLFIVPGGAICLILSRIFRFSSCSLARGFCCWGGSSVFSLLAWT